MFAGIELPLVRHLAGIEHAGQQPVQADAVKRFTLMPLAALGRPGLGEPPAALQFAHHGQQRPTFQVQVEDGYLIALAKQGDATAYDRIVRFNRVLLL